MRPAPPPPAPRTSFWGFLRSLFARPRETSRERSLGAQESRVLSEFCRQYGLPFRDLSLLKLALTHRSYLSVTGQGPRESNERLEFLGDSVLGLVTSEYLYRRHPDEHEGQLTKTKSLLVSKAILSRRALRIGLGRFVLMSHSEVESGGRQRLSILADAFESVIGAVYLDQGFEAARKFIHQHLLAESDAITSDKRHTNYKSHLQEYVQNSFRTHPVYRIRSEYGPDHSKYFMVEVVVGKRTLGEGRGHNKKEAEQAAARDALEKVEKVRRKVRDDDDREEEAMRERGPSERGGSRGSALETRREPAPRRERAAERSRRPEPTPPPAPVAEEEDDERGEVSPLRRQRGRRGGRSRHARGEDARRGARAEIEPERSEGAQTMRVVDAFEPASSAETPSLAPVEDVEEPRDSAVSSRDPEPLIRALETPVAEPERAMPAAAASPPRPMSFGRGRRREPVLGAVAPAAPAAEPMEPSAERLVDPYESSDAPEDGPSPRVVDVADEAGAPETEREREARIEEMERALENFGRRRSPDYGRRGRRR